MGVGEHVAIGRDEESASGDARSLLALWRGRLRLRRDRYPIVSRWLRRRWRRRRHRRPRRSVHPICHQIPDFCGHCGDACTEASIPPTETTPRRRKTVSQLARTFNSLRRTATRVREAFLSKASSNAVHLRMNSSPMGWMTISPSELTLAARKLANANPTFAQRLPSTARSGMLVRKRRIKRSTAVECAPNYALCHWCQGPVR